MTPGEGEQRSLALRGGLGRTQRGQTLVRVVHGMERQDSGMLSVMSLHGNEGEGCGTQVLGVSWRLKA